MKYENSLKKVSFSIFNSKYSTTLTEKNTLKQLTHLIKIELIIKINTNLAT